MSKNKTKFEVSISKSVTVQIWGDLPCSEANDVYSFGFNADGSDADGGGDGDVSDDDGSGDDDPALHIF